MLKERNTLFQQFDLAVSAPKPDRLNQQHATLCCLGLPVFLPPLKTEKYCRYYMKAVFIAKKAEGLKLNTRFPLVIRFVFFPLYYSGVIGSYEQSVFFFL